MGLFSRKTKEELMAEERRIDTEFAYQTQKDKVYQKKKALAKKKFEGSGLGRLVGTLRPIAQNTYKGLQQNAMSQAEYNKRKKRSKDFKLFD